MTLTSYKDHDQISNATSNSTSQPISLTVLGYLSLFGNTFCMVTCYSCMSQLQVPIVLLQAIYVLLQKRFIFNKPKSMATQLLL